LVVLFWVDLVHLFTCYINLINVCLYKVLTGFDGISAFFSGLYDISSLFSRLDLKKSVKVFKLRDLYVVGGRVDSVLSQSFIAILSRD